MPLYPIVGAHYRPPAKALLLGLSPQTPLSLRAEPTNNFDINAIQVILKSSNINPNDHENLNQELSTSGKEISDILSQPEWHLGYIPKEIAKVLRESQIVTTSSDVDGEYLINYAGKPMVNID